MVGLGNRVHQEASAPPAGYQQQLSGMAEKKKTDAIVGYESRIRKFSKPEKIFSVFATTSANGELCMRPFDFVRALMHCDETERDRINANPPKCFKLLDSDGNGLMDFTEFMLLLVVLAVPDGDAMTLFDVLDLDGSKSLEPDEFDQLMKTMGKNVNMAAQRGAPRAMNMSQKAGQHQGVTAPGAFNLSVGAAVPGGKGPLGRRTAVTKAQFIEFVDSVHDGVLELEFLASGGCMKDGISPKGFQQLVGGYASKVGVRSKELSGFEPTDKISFEDYCHFHDIVLQIEEIQQALVKYGNTDSNTCTASRWELQHAIYAVTGQRMTVTQASVLMQMFDSDGDGSLNRDEFFGVLKSRASRGQKWDWDGLEKAGSFMSCIQGCILGKR